MLSLLRLYIYLCVGFMLIHWLFDSIFYVLYGEIEENEE